MTRPARDDETSPARKGGSGLSRRTLLFGAPLALAGCTSAGGPPSVSPIAYTPFSQATLDMYGPILTEPFPVPAIQLSMIDPIYLRQEVMYDGTEAPGTIVIDPDKRFLFHVREGGWATRYGVGVGRQGFAWSGRAVVGAKREWPKWFPPKDMRQRQPELEKYANGMEGGLDNPLGARALYLYENGKDTLYRIHGTNQPWSIGKAMSSGCIRLLNQDIIDLYNKTPLGTEVVVLPSTGVPAVASTV